MSGSDITNDPPQGGGFLEKHTGGYCIAIDEFNVFAQVNNLGEGSTIQCLLTTCVTHCHFKALLDNTRHPVEPHCVEHV